MENTLVLLSICTTLTALVVEALKRMLNLNSKNVSYNILAAVVSVVCALLVAFGYIILAEVIVTPKTVVQIIALAVASWVSSMVSFDKVKEAVKQLEIIKINKAA